MIYVFDGCVLDLDRRELVRASEVVATAPRVFDLLVYLAKNRERVVSRDDLVNAVWAGRIISDSTLASHINAVRKAVGDSGEQQSVIRTVARKGFRFVADLKEVQSRDTRVDPPALTQASATTPPLPSKPSIAVLPFVNLSGDQKQEYLVDGVVEDIIGAFSQYRWLFVVARNSTFTYKGKMVDVKQVGRELGVRYVLEGSWRNANNRVRITGQLIDATTGAHHWAGRFEGVLDDIFELQDQFTESVVGAIAPQLERAEIERASLKPTDSLDAYDFYLHGMACFYHGTREAIDQALPLYRKAIEIDGDFASAYAMAAWCLCWRKINGWMTDRSREVAEGIWLARRAVELGKSDAVALTRSGHALAHFTGDLQSGIALLDKALVLNPNLAAAWFLSGFLRLWYGDTKTALEHFERAMRLSPLDPELYRMQAGMATAHLFMQSFEMASTWAEKSFREMPSLLLSVAILAASQALGGRMVEAQRTMVLLSQLDPDMRLSSIQEWLPIKRSENFEILTDGLRRAGLGE